MKLSPLNIGYCFISLMLMMLLPSSSLVNADIVCPPEADYAPCGCREYSKTPGTIYLNCQSQKLTDSQMSDILDAFLTTPGVSPVAFLSLEYGKLLTRVPSEVRLFNQLDWVFLSDNNITSIDSGAFNFPDAANPLGNLDLAYNKITTIAPGAFKGQSFSNQWINSYLIINHQSPDSPPFCKCFILYGCI